jgi:hypothetical protein
MNPQDSFDEIIDDLYATLARYTEPGMSFCSYCYSDSMLQRIRLTPLRQLSPDDARTLLWESWDHWESQDIYRHYLPRMLQILGSPFWEEDLYMGHVFETMLSLGVAGWPADERLAITTYLRKLASLIDFVLPEDRDRFLLQVQNLERLPNTPLQPTT